MVQTQRFDVVFGFFDLRETYSNFAIKALLQIPELLVDTIVVNGLPEGVSCSYLNESGS